MLLKELVEQNRILHEYYDLRIKHFELILKTLKEDTDKYTHKNQFIGLEIENKIIEVNYSYYRVILNIKDKLKLSSLNSAAFL